MNVDMIFRYCIVDSPTIITFLLKLNLGNILELNSQYYGLKTLKTPLNNQQSISLLENSSDDFLSHGYPSCVRLGRGSDKDNKALGQEQ